MEAAVVARALQEAGACDYADQPFYLVRFRNAMLRLAQIYFSDPSGYPAASDLPEMNCLTYNPAEPDKSSLQVRGIRDANPGAADSCIYVRVTGVRWNKLVMGDAGQLSDNKSEQARVKSCEGQVEFIAVNPDPDIAETLLDGLMTHLEGTKQTWMPTAGLHSFEVVSLSEAKEQKPDPQPIMRATLTATFSGRSNVKQITEALPLKRVTLSINPGS